MANSIQLPGSFDLADSTKWDSWICRFERYRLVTELASKTEEVQVATLIYSLGEKAEDVFQSFNLEEADKKKYAVVKEKFNAYFQPRVNPIFERAKLNMMKQRPEQTMAEHAVALKKQALRCNYATPEIRDECTRDRFVVSILDNKISKKLQMDANLTLESAIRIAAESEEVDRQQTQLNNKFANESVDRIRSAQKQYPRHQSKNKFNDASNRKKTISNKKDIQKCKWCGGFLHKRAECPAKDKKCNSCQKIGHYYKVCKSKSSISQVTENETELFLGSITNTKSQVIADDFDVILKIGDSKINFRIDTDADVSVLPNSLYKSSMPQLSKPKQLLYGPDNEKLPMLGQFSTRLHYKEKSVQENFFVCNGARNALLGRNAAVTLGLIARINSVSPIDYKDKYKHMFQGLGKLKGKPCEIKLKAGASPNAVKAPRRIPIAYRDKVKDELDRMLNLGVIKKIEEPTEWCAPMVVVWKKDNTVRICVDYADLNNNLIRDRTMLPTVDEVLARLEKASVFTKLDQNCGFWQVPLSEESQLLTTFVTPWGRFCFLRLPFGISLGPEYYQARMKEALEGCQGVEPLQDDTIVAGKDLTDHNNKLEQVMKALQAAGIRLNGKKCEFAVKELKFLGHIVNENGVRPDPTKTEAILSYPVPNNKKSLMSFLGMVNHLGKFIKNLSEMSQPVRVLLSKKNEWNWGSEQQQAFEKIKHALATAPTLAHYSPKAQTKLSSDASSYGLGSVLLQKSAKDDYWRPIAYASRTLTITECKYAQIEKEALAMTWATDKFQEYLIGIKFIIETDHKPLVSIFSTKPISELSARLQRFRMKMMRYVYTVEYVPGPSLKIADALSRAPQAHMPKEADMTEWEVDLHVKAVMAQLGAADKTLDDLRQAQSEDDTCLQIRRLVENGWPRHKKQLHQSILPFWPMRHELSIQEELLVRNNRIVIPEKKRVEILKRLHEGHMGIERTRQHANQCVWWPGMATSIKATVENCHICLKEKRTPTEPLLPTELPKYPWQVVGADLCQREGRDYLLITDYYSHFPEVTLLQQTTTSAVIQAAHSIFSRHGYPQVLRSDNGPQFIAEAFRTMSEKCGFTHLTSSPRFPRSNGLIESSVKTVKRLIAKSDDPCNALLVFRSTPGPTGFSPAELLMGRKLRTRVPALQKTLEPKQVDDGWVRRKDFRNKLKQKQNFDRRHRVQERSELSEDTKVWITDLKREGVVVEKHPTPRSYLVDTDQGVLRRNTEHLQVLPPNSPSKAELASETVAESPSSSSTITDNKKDVIHPKTPLQYKTKSGRTVKVPKKLDL